MDFPLDFEECVKDSPDFRISLDRVEADVSQLETRLEKVMALCGKLVEAGQSYNAANQQFLSGLAELWSRYRKDDVITTCLNQFQQGLQELLGFHTILLDQTQRAVTQQLSVLCSQFLPQLADTKKEFRRIGEELEGAGLRNAQVAPHKEAESERAGHLLLATRKCQQHFALDYCLQLNSFAAQEKVDVLNSVFSFVHAQFTFFHQGFDLLRDLEPTMKTMATQLSLLSEEGGAKRKELENKHLLVQQRDASGEPLVGSRGDDVVHGYLFKRSRRKSKTWKRCWFTLRDNKLLYRKSHKEDPSVLFEDLRLCAIKPLDQADRRFCFELLSVQKSCVLQADSEQAKLRWLSVLQGSIDLAYRGRSQPDESPPPLPPGGYASDERPASLGAALRVRGNRRCCDCGESEPRWASTNLAVTVCIECSGIHRSLGVHVSKVRSLTLDSWEAETLKLLCMLGNKVMRGIYEARCDEEAARAPLPDSPRAQKEAWIKAKYVEKKFVTAASREGAELRLYRAAAEGNLVAVATALAQGAQVNGSVAEEEGRTALIGSAIGGSLSVCEFLLQNGANVNHRDRRGRGALHAAATGGHVGQVCLLLKRGANQYAADERGRDPLAIAVETAHADIVTLLRMARMNEEMKDSEGVYGSAGDDETFQEIFRDFSDMASHDPEKLRRGRGEQGAGAGDDPNLPDC